MRTGKFTQYGSRVCVIRVFSYEDRNPKGVIQNPNFEQDAAFENLSQLLFIMDGLFDDIGNPQRAMAPRGFIKEIAETRDAGELPGDVKPMATFRVDVMFRQNASWQGNMVWLDKKQETPFRSALEMIMLMDNALSAERT